jgi:hypothetical protein
MSDTAARIFGLAATAVLLAVAVLALRVAAPPWKRIQRDRVHEQIALAEDAARGEREAFERTSGTLAYVRAEEAATDAQSALELAAAEIESLQLELDLNSEFLAQLMDAAARRPDPDQAEAAHEAYVRLTGTPGASAEELEASRLEARSASGADRLDELTSLDEQRRRVEARLRELRAPATRADEALTAFRSDLDRAEARLVRLQQWDIEIHEIHTPAGGVERCTTCHPGLDDLDATHASLGPGSPFEGWGCTPCHGGNGRALDVEAAHQHLTLRPWTVGAAYSLEPVIAELSSPDRHRRAEAAAFLRRETGRSFGYQYHAEEADRAAAVAAWQAWWAAAEAYYRPSRPPGLEDRGHDASGRPRRHVGAGACLRCHEARQRQHVQRWRATKFTTVDRLDGIDDKQPCLPCHTTGYDEATGAVVQDGVTCEACHGPGAGYSSAMQAAVVLQSQGAVAEGERLLDDVSTQLREQMAHGNICVDCHDPFAVKELAYEHKQ